MESVVVYVLCVAVAFNFVKDVSFDIKRWTNENLYLFDLKLQTHSAPVGGLLSGLFGGEDVHAKQQPAAAAPVDINQLLRRYYTAQSEEQLARYNPFGQINSAISFGQPQQFEAFPAQPAAEPYFAYPNSNPFQNNPYQSPFAPDPYSQHLYPVFRGGAGQAPSAVDDGGAAAAEHLTKQLDSLLPRDPSIHSIADLASK